MVMFFSHGKIQDFGEKILRYFIDNLMLEGVTMYGDVLLIWKDTRFWR